MQINKQTNKQTTINPNYLLLTKKLSKESPKRNQEKREITHKTSYKYFIFFRVTG